MVKIDCMFCPNTIYNCPYNHGYKNSPGLIACTTCLNNGNFLAQLKSKYSLIQMTVYYQEKYNRQVAENELSKLKSSDSVTFALLINTATKNLAAKFINLKQKLLEEEPQMMKKINGIMEKILEKTQNVVNRVIVEEVRRLNDYISDMDETNQKAQSKVLRTKDEVIEMVGGFQLRDRQGRNIGMGLSSENINGVVKILNDKINFFINKHGSLRKLMEQGEKIIVYGYRNQERYVEQPLIRNQQADLQ